MSKNYPAITKKGRGTARSTALCYPILSAPDSRWGQKWVRTGKQRKCDMDDSDSWFLHLPISRNTKSLDFVLKIEAFVVEEGGFEPPKASPADLQSVPFGHSGTPPYSVFGAGGRIRTPDLLITNRFRYKKSGHFQAFSALFPPKSAARSCYPLHCFHPQISCSGSGCGSAHLPSRKWAGRFG